MLYRGSEQMLFPAKLNAADDINTALHGVTLTEDGDATGIQYGVKFWHSVLNGFMVRDYGHQQDAARACTELLKMDPQSQATLVQRTVTVHVTEWE
jgi:hypothetical protein